VVFVVFVVEGSSKEREERQERGASVCLSPATHSLPTFLSFLFLSFRFCFVSFRFCFVWFCFVLFGFVWFCLLSSLVEMEMIVVFIWFDFVWKVV
jgi:hypothetical protein